MVITPPQQAANRLRELAYLNPGVTIRFIDERVDERGTVTGDRGDIPGATDAAWRAAGVYHVLSVSGLHLAVVALIGYGALRRLVAGAGWGRGHPPARWVAVPALAAALAYTLITGGRISACRMMPGVSPFEESLSCSA